MTIEGKSERRAPRIRLGMVGGGSGAFIGTLWEVRDDSARAFSEALYDGLARGKTLGEAMRAGRSAISAGDPTSLAYTLYGNPLARLQSTN